jgi:hypothetical protein
MQRHNVTVVIKSTQEIINSGIASRNARKQNIATFGATTSKQTQLAGDALIPGATTIVVQGGDDDSAHGIVNGGVVSGSTVIDVEDPSCVKKTKKRKSGKQYLATFNIFLLMFFFLYCDATA